MWLVRWASRRSSHRFYLRQHKGKGRKKKGPRTFLLTSLWLFPHDLMTAYPEDAARYYKKEAAETDAFSLVSRFPELLQQVSVVEWNGDRSVHP